MNFDLGVGLQRIGQEDEFVIGFFQQPAGHIVAIGLGDGGVLILFGKNFGRFGDAFQNVASSETGGDGGEVGADAAAFVAEAMAGEALGVHESLAAFFEVAAFGGRFDEGGKVGGLPFFHESALGGSGESAGGSFAAGDGGEQGREFDFLGLAHFLDCVLEEVFLKVAEARAVTVGAPGFLEPADQIGIVRIGFAVFHIVAEILGAFGGGPVPGGAEVEEVVHHVFLGLGGIHQPEGFADDIRRAERDEHLGQLTVDEFALAWITRIQFLDGLLLHCCGGLAVAGDADLEHAEVGQLLRFGK